LAGQHEEKATHSSEEITTLGSAVQAQSEENTTVSRKPE
jgi:hypothetical protein